MAASPPVAEPLALAVKLRFVADVLPVAIRTAVRHLLGLSAPSRYLDLGTEVAVAVIRALAVPRVLRSITDTQRLTNRDPGGVRGPLWVSTYTAPVPSDVGVADGLRDVLVDVIRRFQPSTPVHGRPADNDDDGLANIAWPAVVPVEADWTGNRAAVAANDSPLPAGLSQAELYAAMMREVSAPQPTTVLYLHGGAFWLLDPATHRVSVRRLAKLTGGRCYSVRYRLAPQHAFPAALLDALVSYLTLLYPPPDAFHEPVLARHIVIAGDSAGANLCLALLRVILDLNRRGIQVPWHGGVRRPVPLPAGVAVNSPWLDPLCSLPSWRPKPDTGRRDFDYLPTAETLSAGNGDDRPACSAWPASPPRRSLYVADAMVAHPLVELLQPLPSKSDLEAHDWTGAPPIYCCAGWEMLQDEVRFFVQQRLLPQSSSAVVFEQYEAMPHCFALLLPKRPESRRCFDGWAGFIRRAVEQPQTLASPAASSLTNIEANTLKETPIDPANLTPYTDEDVRHWIRQRVDLASRPLTASL